MRLSNLPQRIESSVWEARMDALPWSRRAAVTCARLAYVLFRDFRDGQLTLRAMGLVYSTLLSLVPLLALAFSLFKAFGIHNALDPVLRRFLAPLGEGTDQIVETVIGFVENVKVGVLGAVGLALLLYAVISLIQKVESGCNYIWQVQRERSLGRRFSEYLSVLIVGPVIVVAATSLTATVTSNAVVQRLAEMEPFGSTLFLIGRLLPYFLYSAGFTFLFLFIPNTKVRFLPALAGGLFAGVLWQTASLAFAEFARSATNVNAIYSSFAIGVFLLIWLYVSWLILLLGCRVAFLLQHPEHLTRGPYPPPLTPARAERLALSIMALVGHNFVNGEPPWHLDRLARHLRAVPEHVYRVADNLVAHRILIENGEHGTIVLPQQDIDRVRVADVLAAVRADDDDRLSLAWEAPHGCVQEIDERLAQARETALNGLTVRDLAATSEAVRAHTG